MYSIVAAIIAWLSQTGLGLLRDALLSYLIDKSVYYVADVLTPETSEAFKLANTAYEPLRRVYEAQQYLNQMNSDNADQIEEAKKELLALNLPGITEEVIAMGTEEIKTILELLRTGYKQLAESQEFIDNYEQKQLEQEQANELYALTNAEYKVQMEKIVGEGLADMEQWVGREWDGSYADGHKIWREIMDTAEDGSAAKRAAYKFGLVYQSNDTIFALEKQSKDLKKKIDENEKFLAENQTDYEQEVVRRDALVEQYGVPNNESIGNSYGELVDNDSLVDMAALCEKLTELSTEIQNQTGTLTTSISALDESTQSLDLVSYNLECAIENIPNTIATMAPIQVYCSGSTTSLPDISSGLPFEEMATEIANQVVTDMGQAEVKVDGESLGRVIDRRNERNIKKALAVRGYTWG